MALLKWFFFFLLLLLSLSHLKPFKEKSTFSTGDRVKIKAVSIAAAKTMQDGCGGWAEKMAGCLGKEGIVELVKLDPFRVRVKIGTSSFVWNPNMVEIVERLKVGQRVCFFFLLLFFQQIIAYLLFLFQGLHFLDLCRLWTPQEGRMGSYCRR